MFKGRKIDRIVHESLPRVISGSLSALAFLQFYSWRETFSGPSKAFFEAVGLFENGDQSSMCLGLTRNAKTNGEHFFYALFIRECLAPTSIVTEFSSNDDLRIPFAFCNWHIEPDSVYCRRFCKRGDFANNQRVYRETRFAKRKMRFEIITSKTRWGRNIINICNFIRISFVRKRTSY